MVDAPDSDPESSADIGVGDTVRKSSPWPLLVALGLVLSEFGIIIGVLSVAVGGLLLFGGSVAGILRESGYVATLWRSLVAFGVVLAAAGTVLVVWQVGLAPGVVADALVHPSAHGQVVPRGLAIAIAGVLLALGGGAGRVVGRSGRTG